jgi:hypothetical protein
VASAPKIRRGFGASAMGDPYNLSRSDPEIFIRPAQARPDQARDGRDGGIRWLLV